MSNANNESKNMDAKTKKDEKTDDTENIDIPLVLRKQGSNTNCSYTDSTCFCGDDQSVSKQSIDSQNKNVIISKEAHETHKWITIERLNELRKRALEAIKNHRVCTIRGCFYSVRKALQQRGWVEKLDIHRRTTATPTSCSIAYEDLVDHLPARKAGETRRQHIIKCERNVLSRLLEHIPVDLLWAARKEKADWIDMARNPGLLHNKFHKVPFTSKEGLCNVLRECYWFYQEGMTEICYPRCYNVWNLEELLEFIEDYRLTACISALKYIMDAFHTNGIDSITSPTGEIPIPTIEFCIRRCQDYIEFRQHEDIDKTETVRIWEHDWDNVLAHIHMITRDSGKIVMSPKSVIEPVLNQANNILKEIIPFFPQYNLDGYLNIWIVKPGNKCRGRGIHLMNDLKQIIQLVNPPIVSKTRYVVQKYIERPLVIHNTKFDIRQWFLVTSVQPMVIWMYKESYLRFSSQEYNLLNYHESVHLTNYAIQKKYSNGKRDNRLPTENMWDCHTFQTYLRSIGKPNEWADRIYPGMQQAIVGSMLASQDNMDRRLNTFELFGADFMILEDYSPWLIEINSSPDLGASTSVTARLCPQCLEDVIKVVVDRRNDAKADTGSFECIYKQLIPPAPAYMGLNLYLKGSQIMPRAGLQKREKPLEDVRLHPKKVGQSVYHLPKTPKNPECSDIPLILNVADYLENKIKMESLNKQSSTMVFKRHYSSNNTQSNNVNQTQNTTVTQNINLISKTTTLDKNNNNNINNNSNNNNNNNIIINKIKTDECINTISQKNINNNDNNNNNTNINQSDSRKLITSLSSTTIYRLNKKRAERNERRNELYVKRHTSCGPRLVVHVEDEATNVSEKTNNSIKEIECIGNRYGIDTLTVGDWDSLNHIANNSSSSSSRNQSLENIHKTKSSNNININQNSLRTNGGGRLASLTKSCEHNKLLTKNKNRTNKYQQNNMNNNSNNNNNINKNHNKNPVMSSLSARDPVGNNKNQFCSHFFAVGMSLRAWRMKYNKLIKPQKENQQTNSFVHACIVPTIKNQMPLNTINSRKKNIIPISNILTLDTNYHTGRKTLNNKSPNLLEKIKK